MSSRKHLTAISRFQHQASQHDNPDLLTHTNKGISVTKTRKTFVFVGKVNRYKEKKHTVFAFISKRPRWQLGAFLHSVLQFFFQYIISILFSPQDKLVYILPQCLWNGAAITANKRTTHINHKTNKHTNKTSRPTICNYTIA